MGPAERPARSGRQACARGRPARAAVGTPCPFETPPHRASEVRSITSASLRGASRTRGLTWRLLTCWAPATSVASAPEETDYYGCTRPYTPVRGRTYARVRRLAHDAVTTSRQRRSAHGRWPRDHVIEISPSHGEPEETGLRRHSGRPLSGPIRTSAFEEKRRNKDDAGSCNECDRTQTSTIAGEYVEFDHQYVQKARASSSDGDKRRRR